MGRFYHWLHVVGLLLRHPGVGPCQPGAESNARLDRREGCNVPATHIASTVAEHTGRGLRRRRRFAFDVLEPVCQGGQRLQDAKQRKKTILPFARVQAAACESREPAAPWLDQSSVSPQHLRFASQGGQSGVSRLGVPFLQVYSILEPCAWPICERYQR